MCGCPHSPQDVPAFLACVVVLWHVLEAVVQSRQLLLVFWPGLAVSKARHGKSHPHQDNESRTSSIVVDNERHDELRGWIGRWLGAGNRGKTTLAREPVPLVGLQPLQRLPS